MEIKGSYLKFVFHKNYENALNPFNQIRFVNISIKANNQPIYNFLVEGTNTFKVGELRLKESSFLEWDDSSNLNKKDSSLNFLELNYSYKTLLI